jgi:aspartyl-tRNA synthetase
MYRTHTCGELRKEHIGQEVTLSGWVQKTRELGAMTFVDVRDRYGITQLVFDMSKNNNITNLVKELGREFVIKITGKVIERESKNKKMPTGDVEILVDELVILNRSEIPPFTIEDDSDGGDEIRMKYRYLDLRRTPLQKALELRHRMGIEVRNFLHNQGFFEIETPYLIKSTPEGARDFVVPSRMNENEFYALPQSPQTFKQLLMISGYDRYFQIVKCFRDEDLRADRQPEFTQIDCEMAFVERDDILDMFENLAKHLFKTLINKDIEDKFPRMPYNTAMELYGSDKPDIRFDMTFCNITDEVKGKGFVVFDNAEYVGAINAKGCASYTRKELDGLVNFVKRPQVGATGLIYVKCNDDGTFKSSVDKFFDAEQLKKWAELTDAKPGDLILVMAGAKTPTLNALGILRLEMGNRLGLMDNKKFSPLWVVDFPLLEWDEESQRYHAMHHPFTSPVEADMHLFETNPGDIKANAYDLVINGVEIGGGSIRIHDRVLQKKMFKALGFTDEQAEEQFGFLMNAFKYGAPPHGGVAFGFDRWVSLFAGLDNIRDVIAFPKNNSGRDVMIDSPSKISKEQLDELLLSLKENDK